MTRMGTENSSTLFLYIAVSLWKGVWISKQQSGFWVLEIISFILYHF